MYVMNECVYGAWSGAGALKNLTLEWHFQFRYQPLAAQVLLQAINESGLPVIADMNDPATPEGFNIAQTFNE